MRYEIEVNQAMVIADQPHVRGLERIAPGTRLKLSVPAAELRIIES